MNELDAVRLRKTLQRTVAEIVAALEVPDLIPLTPDVLKAWGARLYLAGEQLADGLAGSQAVPSPGRAVAPGPGSGASLHPVNRAGGLLGEEPPF